MGRRRRMHSATCAPPRGGAAAPAAPRSAAPPVPPSHRLRALSAFADATRARHPLASQRRQSCAAAPASAASHGLELRCCAPAGRRRPSKGRRREANPATPLENCASARPGSLRPAATLVEIRRRPLQMRVCAGDGWRPPRPVSVALQSRRQTAAQSAPAAPPCLSLRRHQARRCLQRAARPAAQPPLWLQRSVAIGHVAGVSPAGLLLRRRACWSFQYACTWPWLCSTPSPRPALTARDVLPFSFAGGDGLLCRPRIPAQIGETVIACGLTF